MEKLQKDRREGNVKKQKLKRKQLINPTISAQLLKKGSRRERDDERIGVKKSGC
jgi:hypothetical protein